MSDTRSRMWDTTLRQLYYPNRLSCYIRLRLQWEMVDRRYDNRKVETTKIYGCPHIDTK